MRLIKFTSGILGLILAAALHAQVTYTWIGTGTDNTFTNPTNWQGGVAPTGLPTDNWIFTASPQQQPSITDPLVVDNVTFSGIQNGFWLNPGEGGSPGITIYGDVSTTPGSIYWGIFNVPVTLETGNHIYTTPAGSADLYNFGTVAGAGGITKNGTGTLFMAPSGTNTYSGGTTVNAGNVYVNGAGALGTGPVVFNGGNLGIFYTTSTVTLANDFQLGAAVTFGGFFNDQPALALTGNITSGSGVSQVNITQNNLQALYLNGNIGDGAQSTTYQFSASGTTPRFVLGGVNTYTGNTLLANSWVEFATATAIPTSGTIQSDSVSYAGLGDVTPGTTATFLARIDPSNFIGTVGFDSPSAGSPQVFTDNIDMSALNSNVSLGTSTSAILYGAITPPAGASGYNFRGTGQLYLQDNPQSYPTNPLTGEYSLHVSTLSGALNPLVLVLSRSLANDYTDGTFADGGGIVLDSPGALTASGSLNLTQQNSYIGYTENSGLTPADFIARIGSHDSASMIGFDSHGRINGGEGINPTIDSLDLSSLGGSIYVGTASQATLTGNITTTDGGWDDYYFAAYNGGTLTVSSTLSGSLGVHLGLPVMVDPNNLPTVVMSGAKDYTGGTELLSGQVLIDDNASLGASTSPITVNADSSGRVLLGTTVAGSLNVPNPIVLAAGELHVQPLGSLTLSGNISGDGGTLVVEYPNVILSGNNTFSGGTRLLNGVTLTADSNTALGTGFVDFENNSKVTFTANALAPVIGSLQEINGSGTISLPTNAVLTVNQSEDDTYNGSFTGSNVSLVKGGSGALTLIGDNSNLTSTTITAGKVVAGSPTALGGNVILNGGTLGVSSGVAFTTPINFGANGGTLSGNGTFSTPITAGTNVILSPGNSPGTLTFTSGLTLASGGSLVFQVQSANGPAGTGYDLLAVSGSLLNVTATSGAPFTLYLTSLNVTGGAGNVGDFSSSTAYSWTFATSALGVTGFAANEFVLDTSAFTNSIGTGTFSLAQSGNDLVVNFTPVPEPSTYALLALGLATSAFTAYRRRRA